MIQLAIVTPAHSALSCISRGQRAWSRLKSTAEEQRTLWREVGVALMYGKQAHPSNQAFGKWCVDAGFDMSVNARTDAMWYSANSAACHNDCETTHPTAIRKAHREQQATSGIPEDLQTVTTTARPVMDQRSAERAAKVIQRRDYGGEGSDIAKHQVEAMARKNGVTVEEFTEAVKAGAPDTYFGIVNAQLAQLEDFRSNLRVSIAQMEASGMSKDAIKNIFIHFANSL